MWSQWVLDLCSRGWKAAQGHSRSLGLGLGLPHYKTTWTCVFPGCWEGGSKLLTPLSPFLKAGLVCTVDVWPWALRNILSSSHKWCAASVNRLQIVPFSSSTSQCSKGFWKPVGIAPYWYGSALKNAWWHVVFWEQRVWTCGRPLPSVFWVDLCLLWERERTGAQQRTWGQHHASSGQ